MESENQVQERLTKFVLSVTQPYDILPKTFAGRHLGEQLF